MLKNLVVALAAFIMVWGGPTAAWGPGAAAAQAPSRVLGEVTAVDAAARRVTLKSTKGQVVTVLLDDSTVYLRVPPGETTLDKATPIALADLGVGDRVLARGAMDAAASTLLAHNVVVMTKADITVKHERYREEWLKRGVVGVVKAVNPQTREITLAELRAMDKPLVVVADEKSQFRRYAPDSVKFRDARQSSLAEVKPGDLLRALGDRSADGARLAAEEVVFGTFNTVGGTVTEVNAATGEITLTDVLSKKPRVVVVSPDSMLRRLPPEVVKILEASAAGKQSGDLQERIEASPALKLSDLKKGDGLLVSSSVNGASSKMTAILIAAGVDDFLKRYGQQTASQKPINLGLGLPVGSL